MPGGWLERYPQHGLVRGGTSGARRVRPQRAAELRTAGGGGDLVAAARGGGLQLAATVTVSLLCCSPRKPGRNLVTRSSSVQRAERGQAQHGGQRGHHLGQGGQVEQRVAGASGRRGPPRTWAWPATTASAGAPGATGGEDRARDGPPDRAPALRAWPLGGWSRWSAGTSPGSSAAGTSPGSSARHQARSAASRAAPISGGASGVTAPVACWKAARSGGIAEHPARRGNRQLAEPLPQRRGQPGQRRRRLRDDGARHRVLVRPSAHLPTTGASPARTVRSPGERCTRITSSSSGRARRPRGVHFGAAGGRSGAFGGRERGPQRRPADPVTAALVADQVPVPADQRQLAVGAPPTATEPVPAITMMPGPPRNAPSQATVASECHRGRDAAGLADGGGERGGRVGLPGDAPARRCPPRPAAPPSPARPSAAPRRRPAGN